MKKRLISMLMAVLMIASLLPAAALAETPAAETKCAHENQVTISVKKDTNNKTPGVTAKICKDCGEAVSVSFDPFARSWNQCKTCKTGATMVVQAAACEQFGLTVSYCEKCGKAFSTKEFADKAYKVDAALDHVYDNFSVEVKPSCTEEGWGYVTCKLCGDPQFVAGAEAAVEFVKAVNFNSVKDFEARVREVNAMFAAVNPGHNDTTQFVAVTEPMKAADGTELKPAEKASHISTVNGKAYVFNATTGEYETDEKAETFHDGYEGDQICPYCDKAYIKGEPITHTWKVAEKGAGGFPEGNSYGKTDVIECKDCNYTGGTRIYSVNSWYDESTAKEPTCTEPGRYATRYWRDSKGDIQHKVGEVRSETGHNFVAAPGKAVNGHEDGYIYVDYEVCTKCGVYRGNENKKVELKAPSATCKYEPEALVPATCNSYGLSISKCPVCGDYERTEDGAYVTAPIAKVKEHVASDVLANVKAPTCVEKGYSGDVVCKHCNKVLTPGKELDLVDHTPVAVDAKEPTCTEPGVTNGTVCSVCKKVLSAQETVPALGHEYKNGVCIRCKAAQPGYTENPFKDLKKGDRFYEDIIWAANEGIVEGDDNGNYNANATLTRAQVVTMLWRQAGEPKAKKAANFTDLTQNWYKEAVAWAVENGITDGVGNGKFDPNGPCTRAQFVTFLWRANDKPTPTAAANFTDLTQNWYKNAVAWAVENKVTNGIGGGKFAPDNACTRGEGAAFLHRADAISK